jgi:hypothetical protein
VRHGPGFGGGLTNSGTLCDRALRRLSYLRHVEQGKNAAKQVIVDGIKAVEVELTQGQKCLLDPEDWQIAKNYRLYAARRGKSFYVETNVRDPSRESGWKRMMLHKLLTQTGPDQIIDHKSRNPLDCRRSNLRNANHSESTANRGPDRDKITSRYKGVFFDNRVKMFRAVIRFNGKKIHLGYFACEENAARAYNAKAFELFGGFAYLNPVGR